MDLKERLFEKNRIWAESLKKQDPDYFKKLAGGQQPEAMWIGCSDSRITVDIITGTQPGTLFIYRNIANQVIPSDLGVQAAINFAVDILKVPHIMVVGHSCCGGVTAALKDQRIGIIDGWLQHIRDVYLQNREEIDAIPEPARADRLAELNVQRQVESINRNSYVLAARKRGQEIAIHGWMVRLEEGLLQDLDVSLYE